MVAPPELRKGCVWTPASAVQAERSSTASWGHSNSTIVLRLVLAFLLIVANGISSAQSSPGAQPPPESPTQSGHPIRNQSRANLRTIAPYLGLAIDQIEFPA